MGKSYAYEAEVLKSFSRYKNVDTVQTGLLIGQSMQQRDVVVHIALTPSNDFEGKGETFQLDEAWIVQHARQVTRMLPGGLDILGLMVWSTTKELNELQTQIKQILQAIFKSLNNDQQMGLASRSPERLQLHVCSLTQKMVARVIDAFDYKSTFRPAEWKSISTPVQWNCLDTQLTLDLWLPVVATVLLKQMQVALGPLYSRILGAIALVNGQMRDEQETLTSGKQAASKEFEVDMFLTLSEEQKDQSEVLECGAVMAVRGRIHGRGFVNSKATVQEAIQAIKQDLIRSMTARCEIQCEDLMLIEGVQQDPSLVHELPRRVFTALTNGRKISYSDYVFHGDLAIDSLDSFQEVLGLDLAEECIDTTLEQSPASSEVLDSEVEERLSEAGEQVMEVINSQRNILLPVASLAVAGVVAGVSYWVLQRS